MKKANNGEVEKLPDFTIENEESEVTYIGNTAL
jgi:hypothetical protein